MRLLVVSKRFPPAWNASGIQAGKLVAALTAAGCECEVVCADSRGDLGCSAIWASALRHRRSLPSPHGSLRSALGSVRARFQFGYWDYLSAWARGAAVTAQQLCSSGAIDCIVSRSMPEDSFVVAYRIWRKSGVPWVAVLSDPPCGWCPPPYEPRRPSPQQRWKLRWLRRVLPQVPLVVFPSRRLAAYYQDALGIDVSRNSAIVPHIGWRASPSVGAERPRQRVTLLHVGELRSPRRPVDFLRGLRTALQRLGRNGVQVELVIAGSAPPDLAGCLRTTGLAGSVRFLGAVPYDASLRLMEEATAVVLIEAQLSEGIFLPSKLADYAMSGRPVLAFSPKNGEVADIVGRSHPGFMGQTAEGAAATLGRFLDDWAAGADLSRYAVPSGDFRAETVAARFLNEVRTRLLAH